MGQPGSGGDAAATAVAGTHRSPSVNGGWSTGLLFALGLLAGSLAIFHPVLAGRVLGAHGTGSPPLPRTVEFDRGLSRPRDGDAAVSPSHPPGASAGSGSALEPLCRRRDAVPRQPAVGGPASVHAAHPVPSLAVGADPHRWVSMVPGLRRRLVAVPGTRPSAVRRPGHRLVLRALGIRRRLDRLSPGGCLRPPAAPVGPGPSVSASGDRGRLDAPGVGAHVFGAGRPLRVPAADLGSRDPARPRRGRRAPALDSSRRHARRSGDALFGPAPAGGRVPASRVRGWENGDPDRSR